LYVASHTLLRALTHSACPWPADSTFFASRGANVLINDLSRASADAAVKEINDKQGGKAIANYDSATEGPKIVKQAMDKWGRVDVSCWRWLIGLRDGNWTRAKGEL
jgi:hypothetical protein